MPQIQVFQCPSCGANLSYEGGPEVTVTCQFCGTSAVVPAEMRARAAQHEAAQAPPLNSSASVSTGTPGATDYAQTGMAAVEHQIRAGRKIEAIKIYRQITGVGLKEAKDAVEAMERGAAPPVRPAPPSRPAAEADGQNEMAMVRDLARAGQKIEAIELYRRLTGASLKEALAAVEVMAGEAAQPVSRRRARRSGAGGCFPGLLLALGFYVLFFYLPVRLSGSYDRALSLARSQPEVVRALGEPVEGEWWWLWVSRWSCGSISCSARYTMGIRGPEARGDIAIVAFLESGGNYFNPNDWTVNGTFTAAGEKYDLKAPSQPVSP